MSGCPFFAGLAYMRRFFLIWRSPVPEIEIPKELLKAKRIEWTRAEEASQ
jgi:hypothetical protein